MFVDIFNGLLEWCIYLNKTLIISECILNKGHIRLLFLFFLSDFLHAFKTACERQPSHVVSLSAETRRSFILNAGPIPNGTWLYINAPCRGYEIAVFNALGSALRGQQTVVCSSAHCSNRFVRRLAEVTTVGGRVTKRGCLKNTTRKWTLRNRRLNHIEKSEIHYIYC